MSFLKRLGQIIAAGMEIATGFGPLIARAYPQAAGAIGAVTRDLGALDSIVTQVVHVEAIGATIGLSGPDKLRAATPAVVQILMQSEIVAGHTVTDPQALNAAAQSMITAVVQMLNAIDPKLAVSRPLGEAA